MKNLIERYDEMFGAIIEGIQGLGEVFCDVFIFPICKGIVFILFFPVYLIVKLWLAVTNRN